MDESGVDQAAGTLASSTEFSRYDQVQKADYHLAEAADSAAVKLLDDAQH